MEEGEGGVDVGGEAGVVGAEEVEELLLDLSPAAAFKRARAEERDQLRGDGQDGIADEDGGGGEGEGGGVGRGSIVYHHRLPCRDERRAIH